MDPRALIEHAILCDTQGRFDESIPAWLAVASLMPGEAAPYERLLDIHLHRREVDAAFCAASVLASLDALDGMGRELYEDYVPRRLPPRAPEARLDADDWDLLCHPLEDRALGATLFARLREKVTLGPPSADAIDTATFAWAAGLLGAEPGMLPKDDAPPLHGREDLDELRGRYKLRERLFFAGCAAVALRLPEHLLGQLSMRQLLEVLPEGKDAIERWATGTLLTQARAGMLVCGEPAIARRLASGGDGTLMRTQLTLFAVSPEHHRLREKLGIAIGTAADAPAPARDAPAVVASTSIAPFAPSAPARTLREMQLVAALQPCPACGAQNPARLPFEKAGDRWRGQGTCPSCRGARVFELTALADPTTAWRSRYELGHLSSRLLSPRELLGAYEASKAKLAAAGDAHALADAIAETLTCVRELQKLLPPGAASLPGATDERLTLTWLSREHRRLRSLQGSSAPPRTVDDAAIAAHDAWRMREMKDAPPELLARARRLVLDGASLRDEHYGAMRWKDVSISRSDLSNVDLSDASLEHAELVDVVLSGANLRGALLVIAAVERGAWTGATLTGVNLSGAWVKGTDFSASDLEGAQFKEARVEDARLDGVRLGGASFPRAVFRRCSFREASFDGLGREASSSDGAQLTDCDLSGTDWTGFDMSGMTFLRCKFTGARGQPKDVARTSLEECVHPPEFLERTAVGTPEPASRPR